MIVSNDPSPLTFISDYNVRLPEIYDKNNRDEEDIINAYKHRKTQKTRIEEELILIAWLSKTGLFMRLGHY